jgi:putative Mg2+ transporter-C (MgtC) family protein
MIITDQQVIIRLLTAFLISGLIGWEREYYRRPAGLRTNILVGVGSTLITIASIKSSIMFKEFAVNPAFIAAQIVTGIGFIGAGAILHKGSSTVVGLTTAATLWVVAGLGIAIGFGLYTEALATAFLVFFTLFILSHTVPWIRNNKHLPQDE